MFDSPKAVMFLPGAPQGTEKRPDARRVLRNRPASPCHPTQIRRAMLGDTQGTVFLPWSDERQKFDGKLSGGRPRISPMLQYRSRSETHLIQQSELKQNTGQFPSTTRPEPCIRSISETITSSCFDQSRKESVSLSLTLGDSIQDHETPPAPGAVFTAKLDRTADSPSQRHIPSNPSQRLTRLLNAFDSNSVGMKEKSPSLLRQSTSLADLNGKPRHARRVQFASNEHTHETEGVARFLMRAPEKFTPDHFTNPFASSGESESRKTSASSDTSYYLRANAFKGHRDTLARIKSTRKPAEGGRDNSSDSENSASSASISSEAFAAHRDSLTRIHYTSRIDIHFPLAIIRVLLFFLSFKEYLDMRLVCRTWYRALPQPWTPPTYRLPREVLSSIFDLLEPCDFDAARHTCKGWFVAGLDLTLARSMARRAGCQTAVCADIRRRKALYDSRRHDRNHEERWQETQMVSEEWILAKRLATESKLSADWHRSLSRGRSLDRFSRLSLIERINFKKILLGSSASRRATNTKAFTVSSCGRYILICTGQDVFIYKINDSSGLLEAIVRLAADRNVLKVSMDTSSGRYAVAALLEGRQGALWDLELDSLRFQTRFNFGEPMSLGMQTEVHGTEADIRVDPVPGTLPLRRREVGSASPPVIFGSSSTGSTSPRLCLDRQHSFHDLLFGQPLLMCSTPESEEEVLQSAGISIQTRTSARYNDLGSSDDTPRSVAICPQRKCVAFGCRMGIELHWVDVLTGGDLRRWFPLAAPSDYLYFLPQRTGLDSAKKLRLISSAAGPPRTTVSRSGTAPLKWTHRSTTHDRGRRQSMTRLFFGNLPFPSAAMPNSWPNRPTRADNDERHGILRTVDCDHYRAVPLSDGFHVLFTDPTTGSLCLGSDAPLGGPSKLVRKVVFTPPPPSVAHGDNAISCYRAGQELRWGVRIISAHTDGRLILYNVPSDCFSYLQHARTSPDLWDETAGVIAQSDLLMDDLLTAHQTSMADPDHSREISKEMPGPFRALQIDGALIGNFDDDIVDDVAVDSSNGGLRIWVFCRSGIGRMLNVYEPLHHQVNRKFVGKDGLVYNEPQEPDGRGSPIEPSSTGRGRARTEGPTYRPKFFE